MSSLRPWLGWLGGICVGAAVVGGLWLVQQRWHDGNPVIAAVGGTQIHREQFNQMIDRTVGRQVLMVLIERQLIADAAKQYGIYATEAEINQQRAAFEHKHGLASTAQLQSLLAEHGMTMMQFNDELKMRVLAKKIAEQRVTVSAAQIQNYYKSHHAEWKHQSLRQVTPRIIALLRQQNAVSTPELLAQLAQSNPIVIHDPSFAGIKTDIEDGGQSGVGS